MNAKEEEFEPLGCIACACAEHPPKGTTIADAFARGYGSGIFLGAVMPRGISMFADFVGLMCKRHQDGVASIIGECADGYKLDPMKVAERVGMRIQKIE